ncbi:MAG TPA: GNAT family N-acetyltransferase [Cytophagales bacterium]|nr:GNAT family N-acetyltransferase [Cytophagales bacterium]
MDLILRQGTPQDIPAALRLIKELAAFEKASSEVENTEERMLEEGFGTNPVYGFYVAEIRGEVAGISLYFYRYSTWKGKRLFLEDLIVTESHRGKGIGKALFERTITHALETNCNGMSWQVLDWNTPAIRFYEKYQANFDEEWINCSLSRDQLTRSI